MKYLLVLSSLVFSFQSFALCSNNSSMPSSSSMSSDLRFCQGEKIFTDSGLGGAVTAVFPSGEVMVSLIGYEGNHKYSPAQLAKANGCSLKFCVGKTAYTDSGLKGSVVGVFSSGDVALSLVGYSGYHKYSTSKLAIGEGCSLDNFCVEDTVYTESGIKGSVTGVQGENRNISVSLVGYNGYHFYTPNNLAKSSGCTKDDYCTGDGIVTDSGISGSIVGVFKNGRASVKLRGYNGYHSYNTSSLAISERAAVRSSNTAPSSNVSP